MRALGIYGPWALFLAGLIAVAWIVPGRIRIAGGRTRRAGFRFVLGAVALTLFSVAAVSAILPAQSLFLRGGAMPESPSEVVLIGLLLAPKLWVPWLALRVGLLWWREGRVAASGE